MKQIEYAYLAVMCIGLIFISMEFKEMSNQARILSMVGVGIMAFMYSFRRNSRIKMEKRWAEEEGETPPEQE